jgi:hypothetical protein
MGVKADSRRGRQGLALSGSLHSSAQGVGTLKLNGTLINYKWYGLSLCIY